MNHMNLIDSCQFLCHRVKCQNIQSRHIGKLSIRVSRKMMQVICRLNSFSHKANYAKNKCEFISFWLKNNLEIHMWDVFSYLMVVQLNSVLDIVVTS